MAQINKSSDYFNTVLYTGNGTDNTGITGVGFQPDWLWIKCRSNADDHPITDSVRGVTKFLFTNNTNAEATTTARIKSLDSDGFTLGTAGDVNTNTRTYVAWNWLADNTSGSSNTDGSITSTVSANTTSGFSIVTWTGTGANATVGHSLGSVAKMIMVKRRDTTGRWQVYHNSLGATKYLFLDGTEAEQTNSNRWNDTTPTSSVFSLGSSAEVNASGGTYIAYCFAEVKGFSKFGSYTGNGNADGTFIYTGFKPAFVIAKGNSAGYQWSMCDNKRGTANTSNGEFLFAESSGSTNFATNNWDFLSNGFKARADYAAMNSSGISYIYMAFAEEPLVGDNPATAR